MRTCQHEWKLHKVWFLRNTVQVKIVLQYIYILNIYIYIMERDVLWRQRNSLSLNPVEKEWNFIPLVPIAATSFFFFFLNKLTPGGTAFRTVYITVFKLQGQFLQLAPTAGHCKPLPSQQPFFFFFFFPVGGKNINNKNVIGNCCHLQKKWRNEAQTFLSGIMGTPFLRTELCVWGCTAWAVKSRRPSA